MSHESSKLSDHDEISKYCALSDRIMLLHVCVLSRALPSCKMEAISRAFLVHTREPVIKRILRYNKIKALGTCECERVKGISS
jgi:hypothetical protein